MLLNADVQARKPTTHGAGRGTKPFAITLSITPVTVFTMVSPGGSEMCSFTSGATALPTDTPVKEPRSPA
eukprot:5528559-Amphidinium_carterae.2